MGVAPGRLEILAPFIRAQRCILEHQGFQVTLQRGQGRAQIVGDVCDQFAPQGIGFTQALHLAADVR